MKIFNFIFGVIGIVIIIVILAIWSAFMIPAAIICALIFGVACVIFLLKEIILYIINRKRR